MNALPGDRLIIGRTLKAHGLKGALRIESFAETPATLFDYAPFFIGDTMWKSWPEIKHTTPDQHLFIVPLFSHRTQAEAHQSKPIYIERTCLAPLEEGIYYADLINLKVQDQHGTFLGIVRAVHNFGAGEILDVCCDGEQEGRMLHIKQMISILDGVMTVLS